MSPEDSVAPPQGAAPGEETGAAKVPEPKAGVPTQPGAFWRTTRQSQAGTSKAHRVGFRPHVLSSEAPSLGNNLIMPQAPEKESGPGFICSCYTPVTGFF